MQFKVFHKKYPNQFFILVSTILLFFFTGLFLACGPRTWKSAPSYAPLKSLPLNGDLVLLGCICVLWALVTAYFLFVRPLALTRLLPLAAAVSSAMTINNIAAAVLGTLTGAGGITLWLFVTAVVMAETYSMYSIPEEQTPHDYLRDIQTLKKSLRE